MLKRNYSLIEAIRSLSVGKSAQRRWVDPLQQGRTCFTPESKALTPEQQKIQGMEARIACIEREKSILKSYPAFDPGRSRTYALIIQLSFHELVDRLCEAFEVARSGYNAYCQMRRTQDVERLRGRSNVNKFFTESRGVPGSLSIMLMMQVEGEQVGRFEVRGLMRELELVSKQPGSLVYKNAKAELPDIPVVLKREFDIEAPNHVWCGDITCIRARGKRHYLAVVIDPYDREWWSGPYPQSRTQT